MASKTVTESVSGTSEGSETVLTLELRPRRRVVWAEDVVDNEKMNKKKSKRCCIYHKKREFGESSSENDSTSSESESSVEEGEDEKTAKNRLAGVPRRSGPSKRRYDRRSRRHRGMYCDDPLCDHRLDSKDPEKSVGGPRESESNGKNSAPPEEDEAVAV